MKKISILFLVFIASISYAQVGILTQTPRGTLDVDGKLLIDSYAVLENTVDAAGNYYLLVRSNDSTPVGEIKKLDVDIRNVGPVNKYTVAMQNVSDVTVLNINTNLDVSKYYLGLAEAVFTGANVQNIAKQNSDPIHGTYKSAVNTNNGKYTISLNYNGAPTQNGTNGTWTVSLIVFEKVLVKDWGTVVGSVSPTAVPTYTGASTATPLGLQ